MPFVLAAAWPAVAFAGLGELEASIDKDAQALGAAHVKSQGASYSVHELAVPAGSVKEYASWRRGVRGDLAGHAQAGPFGAAWIQLRGVRAVQRESAQGRWPAIRDDKTQRSSFIAAAICATSTGKHMI